MTEKKRRITISDLNEMNWVSDPRISTDGERIAYVVRQVDKNDKKKYTSRIWMVDINGGEPKQMTGGPRRDSNPRWSPDGQTLAFNSDRGDGNQIWLLPMSGGEARQLTSQKPGAGAPIWSPDGKKIAFVARVNPNRDADKNGKEASDVRVITRLRYKLNGVGFLPEGNSQIFVIDVATGECKQITSGNFDCSSPTWSPCSTKLAFSSNRTDEPDYNNLSDIWVVSAEGGDLQKLTATEGPCHSPSWSPCGKYIAYLGHDNKYWSATLSRIMLVPAAGGTPRNLTANFDRNPGGNSCGSDMVSSVGPGLVWSDDSKYIFFLATDGARTKIFRVNTGSDPVVEPLTDNADQVIYGMSYSSEQNRFAVAITSPLNIGDIHYFDTGSQPVQLTQHNAQLLNQIELTTPEAFTCESDGMTIEGWVMKPVGFKPGEKYPAILEIHGGPHSAYGYTFMHEFHLLCAAGYAVIFTNPPGSQGYGQEFVTKTHHDWGGADYRAVMAAVDHVSKFDFIDPDRLGVTGGSYGGYMTNWIIGHDHRFKAAVTQRSTSNRYSMFGTGDVGFMNGQFEFKGNPWDNPEFYLERSPITYVRNVQTPLLIIHSEQDLRCPIEQAEQLFVALKWLRKEVVFVRFPNEDHNLSRSGQPRHREERLEHIINWFQKYIPTKAEEYSW